MLAQKREVVKCFEPVLNIGKSVEEWIIGIAEGAQILKHAKIGKRKLERNKYVIKVWNIKIIDIWYQIPA